LPASKIPDSSRNSVLSRMSFEWIQDFCPTIWYHKLLTSFTGLAASEYDYYLNQLFFGALRPTEPVTE